MIRKVFKTYYGCETSAQIRQGQFTDEVTILTLSFAFNGVRNSDGTYSAAPAWFTQVDDFPLYDTFWVFTEPAESGTQYDFSWTANNKDNTQTEYIVSVIMLSYCDITLGCSPATTNKPLSFLLWLTREGGWAYFPFNGKKSFEVKIPDADTYVTDDYVTHNSQRRGVYNGETLSTGDIPELALDLLQSLKESIQVYYVENPLTDGSQIYYPINLMDGDFIKRKTGEKRWDVKVKFLYSQERIIQSM